MILKIKQAVDFLLNGDLVAFPTETVYGLGADASNENAVNKIFAVKGRPKNHPLIVHLPDISALDFWADLSNIPPYVIDIFQTFSPGPITLILPRNPKNVGDFITGGQNSVQIIRWRWNCSKIFSNVRLTEDLQHLRRICSAELVRLRQNTSKVN